MNSVYDKGELPADLQDFLQRSRWVFVASKTEPAVALLMAQLKYGPWREAFQVAWQRHRSASRVQCSSEAQRAARLFTVLCETVRSVSKTKVHISWMQNAGRFIGRLLGGEQTLKHLSMVKTTKSGMDFWSNRRDENHDNELDDSSRSKWGFGPRCSLSFCDSEEVKLAWESVGWVHVFQFGFYYTNLRATSLVQL